MKTLSDLKRELKIGDVWEVISVKGKPPADKIAGKREICHIQSNAIAFKTAVKSKSWLHLPPASLLEYTGDEIKIFEPGYRPLSDMRDNKIKGLLSLHYKRMVLA